MLAPNGLVLAVCCVPNTELVGKLVVLKLPEVDGVVILAPEAGIAVLIPNGLLDVWVNTDAVLLAPKALAFCDVPNTKVVGIVVLKPTEVDGVVMLAVKAGVVVVFPNKLFVIGPVEFKFTAAWLLDGAVLLAPKGFVLAFCCVQNPGVVEIAVPEPSKAGGLVIFTPKAGFVVVFPNKLLEPWPNKLPDAWPDAGATLLAPKELVLTVCCVPNPEVVGTAVPELVEADTLAPKAGVVIVFPNKLPDAWPNTVLSAPKGLMLAPKAGVVMLPNIPLVVTVVVLGFERVTPKTGAALVPGFAVAVVVWNITLSNFGEKGVPNIVMAKPAGVRRQPR